MTRELTETVAGEGFPVKHKLQDFRGVWVLVAGSPAHGIEPGTWLFIQTGTKASRPSVRP